MTTSTVLTVQPSAQTDPTVLYRSSHYEGPRDADNNAACHIACRIIVQRYQYRSPVVTGHWVIFKNENPFQFRKKRSDGSWSRVSTSPVYHPGCRVQECSHTYLQYISASDDYLAAMNVDVFELYERRETLSV
jgi:hypothetical protein